MEFLREYWPVLLLALAVLAILAFILLRPRQRVQLTDNTPVRPHMAYTRPVEGTGIAGEAAAAVSDVASEMIGAPVHRVLEGEELRDDLCKLKGVGPKFAEALRALGFSSFEQIARLTPTEVERIDPQLGPFRGRLLRDRIIEQADYLARNDIDGFEERFGKL